MGVLVSCHVCLATTESQTAANLKRMPNLASVHSWHACQHVKAPVCHLLELQQAVQGWESIAQKQQQGSKSMRAAAQQEAGC